MEKNIKNTVLDEVVQQELNNFHAILSDAFHNQAKNNILSIQVAQNIVRVSEGLEIRPMNLDGMINYAEKVLKKGNEALIVIIYKAMNQDLFNILPEVCENFVERMIKQNARDPEVVSNCIKALEAIIDTNK